MLDRLFLILVVAFVFVSVKFGAADMYINESRDTDVALDPPCTSNCTAAREEIEHCLTEKKEEKYYQKYREYDVTSNYKNLSELIETLIEKKCIREEYAYDVRCYMLLYTPPDFQIEFVAGLSEEEKDALINNALAPDNKEYEEAAENVYGTIEERISSMTEAQAVEVEQWIRDYYSGCGYDVSALKAA